MKEKKCLVTLILVLNILFVISAQARDNKPSCDDCDHACQFAEDIDELEMGRSVYRDRGLRLEAASTKGHDPITTFNRIAQREFNNWGGRKCEKKQPAGALMAMNMETCTIDEMGAREKLCETRFNYYLSHEQHHVDWCDTGNEHIKEGDYSQTSYGDFSRPCYAEWLKDRDDAKERACNLKVVNALGDEEAAAYDLALTQARLALRDLYLRCNMDKSVEAIEKEIEKDGIQEEWLALAAQIEELFLLLEGEM